MRHMCSLSAPVGQRGWGEVGEGWGTAQYAAKPTSPSHRFAMGPFLSALKGGEVTCVAIKETILRTATP